jgi:segregation and condensation protein A
MCYFTSVLGLTNNEIAQIPAIPTNVEIQEDPRDELVRHLLTYKKVKEAANILKELEANQSKKIARPIDKEHIINKLFPNSPVVGLGIIELLEALTNLMKNEPEKLYTIQKKQYFIQNQMDLVLEKIKLSKRIIFHELFCDSPSIAEIIVTFLALLELTKLRKIQVIQEEVFGQITILDGS